MEDRRMRMIFKIKNHKILEFEIDEEFKKLSNIRVHDKLLEEEVLKGHKRINASVIEEVLKGYMETDKNLPDIIDHIRRNGFYNPYQPALDIIIKD